MGYYYNPKLGLRKSSMSKDTDWFGLMVVGAFILIAIMTRLFR